MNARDVSLSNNEIDVLPDGRLMITVERPWLEDGQCELWRVEPDGTLSVFLRGLPEPCRAVVSGNDLLLGYPVLTRVAADGSQPASAARPFAGLLGESPDGTPASRAFVHQAADLHRDGSGRLTFRTMRQVRGTDATGALVTLFDPPADVVSLSALTRAGDGSLYIAERLDNDFRGVTRIRKVRPDGSSVLVAGVGAGDRDASDGLRAVGLRLPGVHALAVDAAGVLFVLDREPTQRPDGSWEQGHLYAVAADGTWRRIAGFGHDAPGGPALSSSMSDVRSLTIDPTTGRLLTAGGFGVSSMSATGKAFDRLTSYTGEAVTRLKDGGLLLVDQDHIGRWYPDGRYAHVVGAPTSPHPSDWAWDDGVASGDVHLGGEVSSLLPDVDGGVTFLVQGSGPYYGQGWVDLPARVRRASGGASPPVFRTPSALTVTSALGADGSATAQVETAPATSGDELVVRWREGGTGLDGTRGGEPLIDPSAGSRWLESGSRLRSGPVAVTPGKTYSFTVFRRTAAGATSAGVTTTLTVGGPSERIEAFWRTEGGAQGFLGSPVSATYPVPGGTGRTFAGGRVYTSDDGRWTHEVHGQVLDRYLSFGGPQYAPLGLPRTDELSAPDGIGRYNHFAGGSIYWTPATGAHEVRGGIREAWDRLGAGRSALGYPVTDESGTPNGRGRYNHFTGGSIYWTPQTGAHEVRGAIKETWARLGWERSALGYPVTDELGFPGGDRGQDFEGGRLRWSPVTGAVTAVPR